MRDANSLVSVIMPTYNRANLLLDAVNSVLNQTHERLELIIVDDRSTDDTAAVVDGIRERDGRVRYLRNEGVKGCSGAKNSGMKMAEGHYVAFLDDDDGYLPEKIAKQVEILAGNPDLDCVIVGAPPSWGSEGKASSHWLDLEFRPFRLFHPCTVMCSRVLIEKLAFRGDYMEWRDLAFQIYRSKAGVCLAENRLVQIASSEGSLSRNAKAMLTASLNNAREYCELTKGEREHPVFRNYLANSQKNMANFNLKRGRLLQAAQGYANSFETSGNIWNLVPFG